MHLNDFETAKMQRLLQGAARSSMLQVRRDARVFSVDGGQTRRREDWLSIGIREVEGKTKIILCGYYLDITQVVTLGGKLEKEARKAALEKGVYASCKTFTNLHFPREIIPLEVTDSKPAPVIRIEVEIDTGTKANQFRLVSRKRAGLGECDNYTFEEFGRYIQAPTSTVGKIIRDYDSVLRAEIECGKKPKTFPEARINNVCHFIVAKALGKYANDIRLPLIKKHSPLLQRWGDRTMHPLVTGSARSYFSYVNMAQIASSIKGEKPPFSAEEIKGFEVSMQTSQMNTRKFGNDVTPNGDHSNPPRR